jgi:hypothetical protein
VWSPRLTATEALRRPTAAWLPRCVVCRLHDPAMPSRNDPKMGEGGPRGSAFTNRPIRPVQMQLRYPACGARTPTIGNPATGVNSSRGLSFRASGLVPNRAVHTVRILFKADSTSSA